MRSGGIAHLIERAFIGGLARAEAYKVAGHLSVLALGAVLVGVWLVARFLRGTWRISRSHKR